jgi:hypothetical protein
VLVAEEEIDHQDDREHLGRDSQACAHEGLSSTSRPSRRAG